jgi:hypothetical protein
MSSLSGLIYYELANDSAVAALVSDKIYAAGEVPQATAGAFITWQQISATPTHHLTGNSAFRSTRVQINNFGDTEAAARAVADAVYAKLDGLSGAQGPPGATVTVKAFSLSSDIDTYDPPNDGTQRGKFKTILDFEVWYCE